MPGTLFCNPGGPVRREYPPRPSAMLACMSRLAELVKGAGNPISRIARRLHETPVTLDRDLRIELEALLHLRNGFRALGGGLIVRPSLSVASVHGIEEWNQLTLWRTPYTRASELLFFAETIFGFQFGLYHDEVVLFDPETGAYDHYAFGLERWADRVLEQADALGQQAVALWELDHRPLGANDRLQRRTPVRFGGDDTEVRAIDALDLMKRYAATYRANLESTDAGPALTGWWDEEEAAPELPGD